MSAPGPEEMVCDGAEGIYQPGGPKKGDAAIVLLA
jgi:hypothetical protein